ncbi:hypothetical protein LI168_03255 [Desulfovibrio desulfuricans]|uniref:hypothetical protein n=1 Tax=Desulfovibrio desulfuricans TaxID=876 RepID=UPI001D097F14|nr:hypothetical protein [Desulfovibrio desulfuricans]MCB6541154.1 hypothetical protein [Desulfovibrio desulfuricans]MCB6552236.1 hypothetical protein [Desulfovibrio desulfuricans]MCB6564079.1 hypothetical protein [Desulfovibrio desulfuricans]MCB7345259.1 hypothetical protein [Desulfovibrio desulfuricans]MCQ5217288.1 hypothetical protein [Desulfovibrio desulfuricans]
MNIVTLTKRNDGSYVVNGDYHVTNTPEFYAEHAQCVDYEQHNQGLVGIEQEPEGPTFEVVQAAKRAEINAGFDAALTASLTMPNINTPPSTVELTVAIGLFNAEDPVGLVDLCAIHEARRASLLAAVDAATTIAEVQAITVTYAV